MKYQHIINIADRTFRIDTAQCMMTRAGDVFACVFVNFTNINQYRALTDKFSSANWRNGL